MRCERGRDVARARHRRGGRWVVVAVTLGVLAVVTAGTAFAAYQYDASTSDRILPGVSVSGVDVGGMNRDEAVRTLRELAEPTLYSELVVQAAGHSWNVTPASLGMTADVEGAVARSLAVADDLSLTSRVYHRLRDVAVDARFALVDGELVTSRSHSGRELAIGAATDRILEALGQRTDAVEVPVRTVEPSVTTAALGQSIVVDLSENQLYLYDGLKVVADYPVATAAAGYTTPVGTWEVVDKRENPTWYNPAEDTWGADLPPMIAPGPGNPLGTRAIYLNAPGIRIHGTYSSSSIGTYASHGCIRMYISDSEELFDLVDTGTRVIIKP